ncbi:MAG TPA: type 1 glutamine amidotransferase [Allosphingosinicella sp.]|jgi:GMP synthase-like glutamine amidotransferase
MKIAILETGFPPRPLGEAFGHYPDMFRRLLGEDYVGTSYDVTRQEFPAQPEEHDAYLLTGSPAGVYDDLPWILPLKNFLVAAKGKAKLIGVCFGHQVMAEAFGGRVEKSGKGWGVGVQEYRVFERAAWMDEAEWVALPVSHQDQVVASPPACRVLAGSDFCDMGVMAYEDQPAISFQFHPEFETDYAAALIEFRRERLANADAAIASLQQPNDRKRVAEWIRKFVDAE